MCDAQKMKNFSDYIEFLKLGRNTCTQNKAFLQLMSRALLKFVKNPTLFDNLVELFEIEDLHQILFQESSDYINFASDESERTEMRYL